MTMEEQAKRAQQQETETFRQMHAPAKPLTKVSIPLSREVSDLEGGKGKPYVVYQVRAKILPCQHNDIASCCTCLCDSCC